MAYTVQCSIPGGLNINRAALPRRGVWSHVNCGTQRKIGLSARAANDSADDCNEETCASEKEVGKVSMEWVAEEKTKVLGTFPPSSKRRWTGYIEKDTAGQTNIYSIEPTVYVAESAISSGAAGTSAEGAENMVAISFGLGIILVAGASSVLLQVGKKPPNVENLEYSGPPLSYFIKKFNSPVVIETSSPVEIQNAPPVKSESIAPEASPTKGEAYAQGLEDVTRGAVGRAVGTEPAASPSGTS